MAAFPSLVYRAFGFVADATILQPPSPPFFEMDQTF
jgi:hypothetical protein